MEATPQSDLVANLRDEADVVNGSRFSLAVVLMRNAADEIERLRQEIRELSYELSHNITAHNTGDVSGEDTTDG